MRRLTSFVKVYGSVIGPQYLKLLQQRSNTSSRSMQALKRFKKKHNL